MVDMTKGQLRWVLVVMTVTIAVTVAMDRRTRIELIRQLMMQHQSDQAVVVLPDGSPITTTTEATPKTTTTEATPKTTTTEATPKTTTTRLEGSIRLVGGDSEHEGNVEVNHFDRWGPICDDEWDEREAEVVCRQLGYKTFVKATHSSKFGLAEDDYWMDNVFCNGHERKIQDCQFDGFGTHDCEDGEVAGVVCDPGFTTTPPPRTTPQTTPTTKIRIRDVLPPDVKHQLQILGGRVRDEGRVEVKLGDKDWGLVCGDGWSYFEAMVICREMGLGYVQNAVQTSYFGGNKSSIVLSGVQCDGNEETIIDCLHDQIGDVHCPGTDNIAAVVCSDVAPDLVPDHLELMRSAHLEDRQLYFLQCAMEENCLPSAAYRLKEADPYNWHLETRRLMRFTARIINIGTSDFKPFIPKQAWQFHQCHMHYHSMEVFAHFGILDPKTGVEIAEGHKASFCLEDNDCMPGVPEKFNCKDYGDQGISPNCSDTYRYNIDCQWVDLTDLKPGQYQFKISINPEFKVSEITFDNNAALCDLVYTETQAFLRNCTLRRP